jgi:hypothetical protein
MPSDLNSVTSSFGARVDRLETRLASDRTRCSMQDDVPTHRYVQTRLAKQQGENPDGDTAN